MSKSGGKTLLAGRLQRDGAQLGLGGPSLVVIAGWEKPFRTTRRLQGSLGMLATLGLQFWLHAERLRSPLSSLAIGSETVLLPVGARIAALDWTEYDAYVPSGDTPVAIRRALPSTTVHELTIQVLAVSSAFAISLARHPGVWDARIANA